MLTVTLNNAGQGPLRVLGFDWQESETRLTVLDQTFPFDIEAGGETIAVALRPKVLGSFSQTLY